MNTKICCRCGEERSVTEFRKDSSKKDKLRPECKICLKTSEMIFRNENPKEMGERLKKFYEKNPDFPQPFGFYVSTQQLRRERQSHFARTFRN